MKPASFQRLLVTSDVELAVLRQSVRTAAITAGFGLVEQTKLVTAASELARNTLLHGGGGYVEMEQVTSSAVVGLRLAFVDEGPGIRDVEQAMADGWTSAGGLGLGLSGSRRLVDEFAVDSKPGQGTTVTVVSWAARHRAGRRWDGDSGTGHPGP
ncbi:anti-sigma regulatory factor [Streptomyces ambofaciens]|uniref:Anti-sigma regulatory factor n=1 Tax=Streptomyces ambofaciens TaxID=1889 RepID=A0ABM6B9R5_STRAM|nr:ATP-binding protein [Streptomyces ambofaciens]ANB10585.1 anti-sigma regulatory factor [Streptomyces ambofaciens]